MKCKPFISYVYYAIVTKCIHKINHTIDDDDDDAGDDEIQYTSYMLANLLKQQAFNNNKFIIANS